MATYGRSHHKGGIKQSNRQFISKDASEKTFVSTSSTNARQKAHPELVEG
jgi:hypothetical protein